MANILIAAVLLLIIGAAVRYMVKEKKKGTKCIGCPAAGECAGRQNKTSGCNGGCGGV